MLRSQVREAHVADDLAAGMQAAGPSPVGGGLDARPVVLQPAFHVVVEVRGLGAGHEAGAFELGDLGVETFPGLGLGAPLGLDHAAFAGGGILAEVLAEVPDAVRVPEHASGSRRASFGCHVGSLLSGAPFRVCLRMRSRKGTLKVLKRCHKRPDTCQKRPFSARSKNTKRRRFQRSR